MRFTATGSLLKHAREASAPLQLPAGLDRQWLTEAGGYAVFTSTDGSPTLRVALYAAPKPASAMHSSGPTGEVNGPRSTGTFNLDLSGTSINTGPNLGAGFDILSLVKPFELQFARSSPKNGPPLPADPNLLRFVGVTSDFSVNTDKSNTVITFGIEGLGDAPTPDASSSDKEIFIDTNSDGTFDFVLVLLSFPNGTSNSNVYLPFLVNLHTGQVSIEFFTDIFDSAVADTNSFNNSTVLIPVAAAALGDPANGLPALASPGGPTAFQYQVFTFDRNGNQVDQSPLLSYDLANPGFDLSGGNFEAVIAD